MDKLINKLGIDERYTKPLRKSRVFSKVKDNIPLVGDYNFMADILMLPKDKNGFRYLFVLVDLATDEFDYEPLKNKTPISCLMALQRIFKRPHLKQPKASIRTDAGNEFAGVFHKYLYSHNILHRIAEPGRHSQLANVENLNRTLGRLLNGYMNKKEEETGNVYREWTDVLDIIRKDLNKIRKKKEQDPYKFITEFPDFTAKNKYNVGDLVYRKAEKPINALRYEQNTDTFRMGDYRFHLIPEKVEKITYYTGLVPIRYILKNHPNVAYAENELLPAREQDEMYYIKKIIDKKGTGRNIEYLIWWDGYKKKDSTWETKTQLIKDGADVEIKRYEDLQKAKKKRRRA